MKKNVVKEKLKSECWKIRQRLQGGDSLAETFNKYSEPLYDKIYALLSDYRGVRTLHGMTVDPCRFAEIHNDENIPFEKYFDSMFLWFAVELIIKLSGDNEFIEFIESYDKPLHEILFDDVYELEKKG